MLHHVTSYIVVRAQMLNLRRDQRGVTALEYGLIAALVCVALATSVTTMNGKLGAAFTAAGNAL